MDPLTIIAVAVIAILLVWVVTRGGMNEPGRTIIIAVLAIVLLVVLMRLLGLF